MWKGNITVRERTNRATLQYKKAIKKQTSFWVCIEGLKLADTGAMIDPDDLICDVCEDRVQLTAILDSQVIDCHGQGLTGEISAAACPKT